MAKNTTKKVSHEGWQMLKKLASWSRAPSCLRPRAVVDARIRKSSGDAFSASAAAGDSSFSTNSAAPLFQQQQPEVIHIFTMAELNKMTSNFSETRLIGQGGFGAVYSGVLKDGTLVAVKRAKKNNTEARISQEFRSEIQILGSVEHLNLVKLLGYLEQDRERIIVSEFVPNGNLRQHLDVQLDSVLNIATRLDILIDVAHAVTYLHVYADRPIIHRDIKSSNILLTRTFRAKVADFGFSRVGPSELNATHVSTQVKGTAGYVDPEYLHTYQLTDKSDVYSFGILMAEVVTGRRPIELMRRGDERVTIRWVYQKFSEGNLLDIIDKNMELNPDTSMIVEKIISLALHCVAPTRTDRPSMKEVAVSLWNIRTEHRYALQKLIERHASSSRPVSRSSSRVSEKLKSPQKV